MQIKSLLVYGHSLINQWIDWDLKNVSFTSDFSSIKYNGLGRRIDFLLYIEKLGLGEASDNCILYVIKVNLS